MRLRSGRKLVHRDESSENKSTSIQHNRSAPGRRRKKGNGAKKGGLEFGYLIQLTDYVVHCNVMCYVV